MTKHCLQRLKLNRPWGGFNFLEADPQIFLQPSYVKVEGKSLSSSIPLLKLNICYICVTLVYLLDIYMIDIAFMWNICDMIANTCDIYVT